MITPAARRQVKRSTPFKRIAPAIKLHIGTVPLKMPAIVGAVCWIPQDKAANGSKIRRELIVQGRHNCCGGHLKEERRIPNNTTKNTARADFSSLR